jgi:outer membrane lipoprotein-sorting protein
MNKYLLLFVFLSVGAFGQSKSQKAVENIEEFKRRFSVESQKITSVTSDFTQEKTLTMLTEKITSKGNFWFKRSDKVRIEYKTPYSYLMIINGDQMISKDGEKVTRINVSSNKMLRQLNRIIVDCVQGTILSNKEFTVKVLEDELHYWIDLKPINKVIADFFQTIQVKIDKKDYSVSTIELLENGGDKTLMQFTNKQFNNAISDEVFILR